MSASLLTLLGVRQIRSHRLADQFAAASSHLATIEPLINMQKQIEKLKTFVNTSRNLLNKNGVNDQVIIDTDQCAGTCQVITTQLDLTVKQIEKELY